MGGDSEKVDTRTEDGMESTKEPMLLKKTDLAEAKEPSVEGKIIRAVDGHIESLSDPPGDSTVVMQHPRTRVIRTVVIVLAWVCMGLFSEITGPTLPYLKQNVDSNFEEISRAMAARSVGYLVGSLSGGLLCELCSVYVDVWLAFALALAAVATAVVPWCHSLTLMAVLMCSDGLAKGILAAGGNAFMLRMWGVQAAVPVHALHTAFGIGAFIAPLIVRPFLGVISDDDETVDNVYNVSLLANTSSSTSHDLTSAAIEYPYSIIAAFTLLVAVIFVLLYWFAPIRQEAPQKKSQMSAKDAFNPSSWLGGDRRLGYAILMFSFFIFMLPVGMERAYGKFLFSIGVTGRLKLSPADGTLLESWFWATFTAGRLLVTLAAARVSQIVLILVEISVNVAATASLVAYGQTSATTLAVFSGLFAAGMAPLYPTLLSWLNLYVEVTAMLTCMTFFSSACGAFVYSWLGGYLFQYEGPESLLYFMLASACACAMIFAPLYFSAVRYERGFPRRREMSDVRVSSDGNRDETGDARTKL